MRHMKTFVTAAAVGTLAIALYGSPTQACEFCDGPQDSTKTAATNGTEEPYDGPAVTHQIALNIEGMTCGGCSKGLTRAFLRQAGVVDARVEFKTKRAVVSFDPTVTSAAKLVELVNSGEQYKTEAPKKDAISAHAHLDVEGLAATSSAAKLTKALKRLKGVRDVHVDVKRGGAVVEFDPGALRADELVATAKGAGFIAALHTPTRPPQAG